MTLRQRSNEVDHAKSAAMGCWTMWREESKDKNDDAGKILNVQQRRVRSELKNYISKILNWKIIGGK